MTEPAESPSPLMGCDNDCYCPCHTSGVYAELATVQSEYESFREHHAATEQSLRAVQAERDDLQAKLMAKGWV